MWCVMSACFEAGSFIRYSIIGQKRCDNNVCRDMACHHVMCGSDQWPGVVNSSSQMEDPDEYCPQSVTIHFIIFDSFLSSSLCIFSKMPVPFAHSLLLPTCPHSHLSHPLSTHSVSELETGVALLKQILTRKKPYLEKVIEYTRFKGISPEQYAEMEAMFKQVCVCSE